MSITKTADDKGRVSLGKAFANKHVIIDSVDETEIRVRLARVVPEREAWLLSNDAARTSLHRGLAQAANGEFADPPPDLEQDLDLCEKLEGED